MDKVVKQTYLVGPRDRKTLAILPSRIVKEYDLDTSTIFIMRVATDNNSNVKIIMEVMDAKQFREGSNKENMMISAGNSLRASGQHIPSGSPVGNYPYEPHKTK